MPTNALAPINTATGGDIINLGALLAQIAAETQRAAQGQAGYYDPSTFGPNGTAGFAPTLERELGMGQLGVSQQNANTSRDLGFGNLALGKDQLAAAIRDADRQYQLDVQRFGLDTAKFNYDQRIGEAQTRLQQLGLLASQRGPQDYLAYNYVLNDMAAPPGQQVDPFQMTAGLNQQYTAPPVPPVPPLTPTNPSTLPGAGGGAAPSPSAPTSPGGGAPAPVNAFAPPPQAQRQPPSSGAAITGNRASDQALLSAPANASGPGWQGADAATLAEFERISQNMANAYATQVQNTGGNPGYARGGVNPGGIAIVGDKESGRPTHVEEAVVSPYPFTIMNHEDTQRAGLLDAGASRAAGGGMWGGMGGWGGFGGGQPDVHLDPMENPGANNGNPWAQQFQSQPWYQALQQWMPQGGQTPGQMPQMPAWMQGDQQGMMGRWATDVFKPYLASRRQGQTGQTPATPAWNGPQINQSAPAPESQGFGPRPPRRNPRQGRQAPMGPVRAATGGNFSGTDAGQGFFNFNVHSPADTANAPFVQKTLGNQASAAWNARGAPLGQFGAQPFNYANYLQMAPTEQLMLQGLIETPSVMGGYGGSWQDELNRAQRSSFQGQSFSPATYG